MLKTTNILEISWTFLERSATPPVFASQASLTWAHGLDRLDVLKRPNQMVEHEAKNLRNMLENTGNMKSSSAKIWKTGFSSKKPMEIWRRAQRNTHILLLTHQPSPAANHVRAPVIPPFWQWHWMISLWLWLTSPWFFRWPIEIDGLPNLKMGGFSMANC